MRPMIGVTGGRYYFNHERNGIFVGEGYTSGLLAAGALPVVLPPIDEGRAYEYIDGLDGLLLTGGVDVDPNLFGEQPIPGLGEVDPERDDLELRLLAAAAEKNIPVLGICRGIQVMNVGFGGTLYQDMASQLDDQIQHAQKAPQWHVTHSVEVAAGTKLSQIFGPGPLMVNSFHHQSIRHVGSGFIVSAEASDGTIEAVESPTHRFIVGVQWHPERLWQRNPDFLRLFQSFVDAATQ